VTRLQPPLIDLSLADDVALVGGKALNLSRLCALRVPTPGGAVIPDGVFQRHLHCAGADQEVARLHERLAVLGSSEIEQFSAVIRERVMSTALEPALKTAWNCARETLWKKSLLAVRSSAVGEDDARHSFAGQLDSVLNVDSDAGLEAAVKATWSSLFSLRVLLYARHKRVRVRRMGVIVQRQIDARWSGVLFTRDPGGLHADAMLAEYCAGLGEQVVSGRVTPDRLWINRRDLALNSESAGDHEVALPPRATRAVRDIARMGLELEAELGCPQDIEWCVDGDNAPVLVQCRPARVAAREAVAAPVHWSNANIAENFPEPVSPFLYSVVKPGYSAYFRNLGRGFGIARQRLVAMAEPLEDVVGLQGGRLYYNLTNINALIRLMPAGRRLVAFFNLFVGAQAIPAPPTVYLGRLARALESVRIALAVLWQYVFIQGRVRRFEARVDAFAAATQLRMLNGKTARELAADLQTFLTIRLTQWNDAALADTAAMVCYGLLKAQLSRSFPHSDHTGLHNDLLKGLPDLASARPVTRLWWLSRDIDKDAGLRRLFTTAGPDEILAALDAGRFPEFRTAFADYLEHWGFRSSAELMLTAPTPEEDPRPVLRLLQAYVRAHCRSPEDVTAVQMREREAVTDRIAAELSPGRWWRCVPLFSRASRFRWLLGATQGAIKLRERARMKQALLYTRLRHIALHLGDHLVARGVICQRDDIFLLTTAEVLDLFAGHPIADLGTLIDARRDGLQNAMSQAPPDHLVLRRGEAWAPSATEHPGSEGTHHAPSLTGSGACGGFAAGRAAVVLDVANADRVEAGQILVTRQTDPGWATVFFLVHGLVIERGGMLSHGAIIAREYGIPAVVGVTDATRLIRDGDTVRVDGDRGLVELNIG
jgi:phosphohistidine swiveling domain-containing protein